MNKASADEKQVYARALLKWREQSTTLWGCFKYYEDHFWKAASFYGAVLIVLFCAGQPLLVSFWLGIIVCIPFVASNWFKSNIYWSQLADDVTDWVKVRKWATGPAPAHDIPLDPKISGKEQVLERFGRWPSFHDAEVLRINLDRRDPEQRRFPTLEIAIHCWERSENLLASGHFETSNHSLIHLRFRNVSKVDLKDFNIQNVLHALSVIEIEDGCLQVTIDGIYGLDGSFVAGSGEVVSVEPYEHS